MDIELERTREQHPPIDVRQSFYVNFDLFSEPGYFGLGDLKRCCERGLAVCHWKLCVTKLVACVIEGKVAIDRIGDRTIQEQLLVLRRERRLAVGGIIDVSPGVDQSPEGTAFRVTQTERAFRPLKVSEQE